MRRGEMAARNRLTEQLREGNLTGSDAGLQSIVDSHPQLFFLLRLLVSTRYSYYGCHVYKVT